MTPNLILWIYIALLLAGGLMGFLKAKSKASLIASSAFAAVLAVCALGVIPFARAADVVLAVLLVFFGMRFAKSRKFMPAGLMSILTVVALVLRFIPKT
jgi:uncharacterized membrane protein (UPF0136 family)